LRFHWSPPGDPGAGALIDLCSRAEAAGVESVEVNAPELALLAASQTATLRFRVPYHAAVKTTARAAGAGRLAIRMKIEHTDVAQAGRDLDRCRDRFSESEIHVEGDSAEAAWLTILHADCLFRSAGRPDQAYADALPVLHLGKEVGLKASVIARRTRGEAIHAADLPEAPDVLAGSFEEVAAMLLAYRQRGISHFLIRGRAGHDDLTAFGSGVLPLLRELERGSAASA
jgi:alkanesulfonate monooxygenase SsuD/methylene tetrahydromethanopterin reductase-like flavin-dependent oxidoreductase (luciferase family)